MDERHLVSLRSIASLSNTAQPLMQNAAFEETIYEEPDDAALRAVLSQALAALAAEQEGRSEGVMVAAQDRLASLLQSRLLEDPPSASPTTLTAMRSAGNDVFEVKFDEQDIAGWIGSLFTWVKGLRKEKWLPPPTSPETLSQGNKARVALLSDWGTGLYGAPACAESIKNDSEGFDLVMHLGDVYYSGTNKEANDRFLKYWQKPTHAPNAPGGEPISRTLNGNHEMYTGGEGYFKAMLPAFGQQSSCCALELPDWLLIGLDSAYEDHDLTADQLPWLDGLVARAEQRNQRVVLFSHHQPFSLLDHQGPKLVAKLSRHLSERKIFAWYWGHEHRCILYDAHPTWAVRGRCIGHGGYPYFRDKLTHCGVGPSPLWRKMPAANLVPSGVILDARNDYITGEEDTYGANGYVTLEFDGVNVRERVHAPDGTVLYDAPLS